MRPDVREFARSAAAGGRVTHAQAAVGQEPNATPSDAVGLGFIFVNLTVGELRQVLDRYGPEPSPGKTDKLLVDLGVVSLMSGRRGPAPKGCSELRRATGAGPEGRIQIYAPAGRPEVKVRRFGTEWVTVGRLWERRQTTLFLPGYHATDEWELSAEDGVCVLGLRP